jgi:uncharacterized protein YpmS
LNRWKISFFLLAGFVAAVIAMFIYVIGTPPESDPIPEAKTENIAGNILLLRATKADFEGIANTYIRKAVKIEPLPIKMEIGDDIILVSELTVFSITLPVIMHFDPIVLEDGNLILKQSSMEIGNQTFPPSVVLNVLKETVKLPPWMIVRPKEEELFIDLSAISVSGNLRVKAKEFNLKKDEIILEIIVPKE